MSYISIGKKSATLLTGGSRKGNVGQFIEPTIFLNPNPDSPVLKDEIFGPVMTVQTFETEEEAIAMANDSTYGLAGTLWAFNLIVYIMAKASNLSLHSVYLH
jgi:aldehyde dehydrogenase (NAD+)